MKNWRLYSFVKNNITISDLMAKVNRQKAEMKKEKTNENQFEKE